MNPSNCKRCLLHEMNDSEYAKNIYDYIASIPDDIKTGAELLQERLELCRACDALVNGMCKFCGCFVEVRAAKKSQTCPHPEAKWR